MKIQSDFDLDGRLSISKVYADGYRELTFEEDNLIVKASKLFILSGIYSAGITSDPIISLKVGTGGNIDPNGLYAKPEDPLAVGLTTPVLTIATVNQLDLPNIQVTFLADVDQSQCNGLMLSEAGLFKTSGAIFNVKNHPGITKTSDFAVHYAWTIKLQ